MVHPTAIAVAAAALLGATSVNAGLYPKSSAVLPITGNNYDRLIVKSNYTSIVEFYAPWCGHCKELQPHYEKAAKSLAGLAKVAAVDCDEDSNKAFCGKFGVQGFPTLKIIRPGSKGKPIVEDYNGARSAKAIVDAVLEKIPNHVTKVEDKSLEKWLADSKETPKAILFTDKGKTSALMKSIAIDFKGVIEVAQIRNKEVASVELFGITEFPTLVLLPGGKEAKEGITYDGELKKDAIVKFLSQAGEPNPDPAPTQNKAAKSKDKKNGSKKDSKAESGSSSSASKDGKAPGASATEETIVGEATESPLPVVEAEKPIVLPAPTIPTFETEAQLKAECLGDRTGTCIFALVPETPNEVGNKAILSLSELAHKYTKLKRQIFPFHIVPATNPAYANIKNSLKLTGHSQVIAVNGRRGWWRQISETLTEKDVTESEIENFVDAIRLGEGAKQKIPSGLISEETASTVTEQEPASTQTVVIEEVKKEPFIEKEHDEL